MSRPPLRPSLNTVVDLCVSGSVALLSTWWWHQFPSGGLGYGCLVGGALLLRRRWPTTVFLAVSLLSVGMVRVEVQGTTLHEGMLLIAAATAMYAAVRYARTVRGAVLIGLTAVVVGTTILVLRSAMLFPGVDLHDVASAMVIPGGFGTGVWATALIMRTRHLYQQHAQERAVNAERERAHLMRIAVAEERAQIARDLHDIVAHSLSVMVLHANGAEYALDRDPERARAALRTISATGQDALGEIKQLVQMLRSEGGDPAVDDQSPAAALEQVSAVVERARSAGLAVNLIVDGTPPQVPSSVALAVYRIVQEALTNTLKHAGPAPTATVRVRYQPDTIDVEVTDTGAEPVRGTPGGHGLVGMRERVNLCGGVFDAGPYLGGGWRVLARIPLAGAAHRAVAA